MTECLFCRIVQGEIAADIVYQDESVIAFRDIQPQVPTHVLVVPRRHVAGYNDLTKDDDALLGSVGRAAAHVAQLEGIGSSGYRCVVNSGQDALQSVPHLHVHVLGGRPLSWPPG